MIAVFAFYLIGVFGANLNAAEPYPFGDFFALWSYAKIALSHPAAELYDVWRLHDTQVALGPVSL